MSQSGVVRVRFALAVVVSLACVVQPFDEDPALFLLNNEFGSSISERRQRLAPSAGARPRVVGWTDDAAKATVEQPSPSGVQAVVDDPELLGTLYGGQDSLGESSEKQPKQLTKAAAAKEEPRFKSNVKRILGTFTIEVEAGLPGLLSLGEGSASIVKTGGQGKALLQSKNGQKAASLAGIPAPKAKSGTTILQPAKVLKHHGSRVDGEITSAKKLINDGKTDPKVKQIAMKFLEKKQQQAGAEHATTIEQLSQQLFQAKVANTEMFKLKVMAAKQFQTPVVGETFEFGLGAAGETEKKMTINVDGVEFNSGANFRAPEGHIVSEERCQRYLKKYDSKALVAKAQANLKVATARHNATALVAKELSSKAMLKKDLAAKSSALAGKGKQLGSSRKEGKKADTELVEAETFMEKAATAVRAAKAAKKALVKAGKTLRKAKAKEVKNKDRLVKNDNLDARQSEILSREQSIAEREFVYKQAAGKLQQAAEGLKSAAQNQAVMAFPTEEKVYKADKKALQGKQEELKKKELALHHKAELLAARMNAFNDAVKSIIDHAAKSSTAIADSWSKNSDALIGNEVDGFTSALQTIKDRFSSSNKMESNAAKDGAKIVAAVHNAVKQSTAQLQTDQLTKQVNFKKNLVEDNVHKAAAKDTSGVIAKKAATKDTNGVIAQTAAAKDTNTNGVHSVIAQKAATKYTNGVIARKRKAATDASQGVAASGHGKPLAQKIVKVPVRHSAKPKVAVSSREQ